MSVAEHAPRSKALDRRTLARLWTYVLPYRGLAAIATLVVFAIGAVQVVQPYLIKLAIDGPIANGTLAGLTPIAALFCAALAAEFLLRFAQLLVLESVGQSVVRDVRVAVFAHLQRLSASFFDRNAVGRLMTRVTSDVEALAEALTSGLVLILADGVKLLAIVAVLLWMDWRLALVTFAIVPPMVTLTAWFQKRIREAYQDTRSWVARMNAFLQENVVGMRLVQLFGRERDHFEEFTALNDGHHRAQMRSVWYDSAFSAVAELVGSIALAAILWAGGARILAGSITFGTLVAFIQYANRFFGPLQELSERWAVMQAAGASSERIFDLLDTRPEIVSPAEPRRPQSAARGAIVFDRVTFGYDPAHPVLRDVSFRIAPGQRVGVVGWTGSGKSTLIRLLIRLYEVQEGRILLDGVDVRDWDLAELRRAVGVVHQDPFLFAGTVESNLTLGDPRVSLERVREAVRAVDADRIVERLPGGWREEVRERGSNFSVGEKQLLAFARALAFEPTVLVLDEATSSVDAATESRIREALRTALAGRTSILIAHRLATVRDADRILVLHHGELREDGSHDALVRLDGGIYRTLVELQAG